MAVRQTQNLLRGSNGIHRLHFSTSSSINNKWRLKQGLESNPNKYGPMKLLPDYSFVDGRPVPLGFMKLKKLQYQQTLCQRIVELNYELDVGLQQYYENEEQKQKMKTNIIQNKLKPKGAALLKKGKQMSNIKKNKAEETQLMKE